jgi:hypothetical protein
MSCLRQQLWCVLFLLVASPCVFAQRDTAQPNPAAAEQLFALANQSRAQAGAGRLSWDPALAQAAMKHCMRMVSEGTTLAHRYNGEPDLGPRAEAAGAHFSLLEENIAIGSYADQIHQGWLDSPGHRRNLLNPEVDRVGIAVVAARGVLYAVADYDRAVAALSPEQVESRVADQVRMGGMKVVRDPQDARAACRVEHGFPRNARGTEPGFVMRWQGADLNRLPQPLVDKMGSGQYRSAAVGACSPTESSGSFTAYRIAVLLY